MTSTQDSNVGFAGGKTAVLTGAAGGMGRATAAVLISAGWQVLGIDHNHERLTGLASTLGPAFHPLTCDLADPGLSDMAQRALDLLPPVTGLVSMAGISRGGTFDTASAAEWDLAFAVNTRPALILAQLVAAGMRGQGSGSIVNVGSPVGVVGARKPHYAASKAALHGLTMSLARTLGADGVRVNLLLPGPTITHMTDDWPPEQRDAVARGTVLKRLCEPEEIARTIAFLLGPDSSYLTASVIDMTAGSMMGH